MRAAYRTTAPAAEKKPAKRRYHRGTGQEITDPAPPKLTFPEKVRRRKNFSHRDALRKCRKVACLSAPVSEGKQRELTDLEVQYLVAALEPGFRPQSILGRRYYTPKPSVVAAGWIFTAIQSVLEERAEREGWTGDGVHLKELLGRSDCEYSYATLRIYVCKLTAAGALQRIRRGVYQLGLVDRAQHPAGIVCVGTGKPTITPGGVKR